jgi:hypothetical protein
MFLLVVVYIQPCGDNNLFTEFFNMWLFQSCNNTTNAPMQILTLLFLCTPATHLGVGFLGHRYAVFFVVYFIYVRQLSMTVRKYL